MTNPADQLYHRMTDALGAHDVHPEKRGKIVDGYRAAGGDDATWDDLDDVTKGLIIEAEALPRTAWDDPADVPDEAFQR